MERLAVDSILMLQVRCVLCLPFGSLKIWMAISSNIAPYVSYTNHRSTMNQIPNFNPEASTFAKPNPLPDIWHICIISMIK